MDASILVLCTNRHFTGVTVTFYRCFGRFTGFRDGQGVHGTSTWKSLKHALKMNISYQFGIQINSILRFFRYTDTLC